MLKLRVISAVIGAPIILLLLYLGRIPFGLLILFLSAVALIEFYAPWPNKNTFPMAALGIPAGLIFVLLSLFGLSELNGFVVIMLILTAFIWQILLAKRSRVGVNIGLTVLGALYAGLLPSYLILLRDLGNGWIVVLLTILAVWASDITSYAIGSLLGRTKLASDISPNKTVEGAIAGVLVSIIVLGAAYMFPWLPLAKRLLMGLLIGVFCQIGDLAASTIKRELGIKDFGRFIPGHGGVLDRFDGLFFVAPIIFYFFKFF